MEAHDLIPADPWLAHLELQIEALREGEAPDAVHQLRVAASRLSVWIELQGRRALRDDLRWLRRSAMELRDLDVLRSRDRSEHWNERLDALRADALLGVRVALAAPRLKSLLLGLACVPAPDGEIAARGLARIQRRVLRAGARLAHDDEDPGTLHRLRRRVRRLRYACDWLGADATQVRSLQDALGELNDLAVELRHIELLEDAQVAAEHAHRVEAEFERGRVDALRQWNELRPRLEAGASREGRWNSC